MLKLRYMIDFSQICVKKYDPTSEYLASNDIRNRSNLYARNLYQWCRKQIEYRTGRPFDFIQWNEVRSKYANMSSQGWIDLYNNFRRKYDKQR